MSQTGFSPLSRSPAPYGAAEPIPSMLDGDSMSDRRRPVDPNVFVNAYTRPLPSYAETFSGPGYESRPLPTSGWAIAALVCGILGPFVAVTAPFAIVLGHVALYQTSKNTHLGRGMAIGAIVLGYGIVATWGLVLLGIWISGR